MRYPATQTMAKEGHIFVQKMVNEHGSIFHPVHQENDLGVDAYIELVKAEESTSRLVAVQIKSGESYFNSGDEFVLKVDERHLNYWLNFTVPVVLIGYSPRRDAAVWTCVREYVRGERNFYREPIRQIRIPAHCTFDTKALSTSISHIAVFSDASLVLDFVDMCLSDDPQTRYDGLVSLGNLSGSQHRKITVLMARRLLMDADVKTAEAAVGFFGFYAALNLRLWATVGPEQLQQCHFAFKLCEDLTEEEISKILEFYDDASFEGLLCRGDELIAMIAPTRDRGRVVLNATARDPNKPIKRRANALRLLYGLDNAQLRKACEELGDYESLRDVVDWIFGDSKHSIQNTRER